MKPFEVRAVFLAVAVLLTASSLGRAVAQALERPCPPTGAETIFARPVFAWTYGTGNLLTNPGFEDGTNGWELSPGGLVLTSPPNGAAEGTNAFRVAVGRLSREVSLPVTDTGLSLSYALRGLHQLIGPKLVEIEPVDGSEPPVSLPIPGFTGGGAWVIHTADLSAYRGRTVRLTWKFPAADGVLWYLDDVRITPVAPNTEFEIWWRRNRAAEFELLTRTALPSVTFPELQPNVRHEWRVNVIADGTTNIGPVWTFTTAFAFGAERLTWAPLPSLICPEQPLTVAVRATDERGFPARNASVTVTLGAAGPDANPAGVLITEIDIGVPDGVEFQNVTHEAVDLSGWQVELFRTVDTTVGGKITIPPGSVLAPGARFTITENRPPSSPWPSLGVLVPLDWDERTPLSVGVVLRNVTGEVKDAMFVEPQPRLISGEPLPRNSRTVALDDWRTLPIASAAASGETYQRVGGTDQNVAADWVPAPRSFGQANEGMSNSFRRGFGALPIAPKGFTNIRTDSQGWVFFPVTVSGEGSNATVQARLRTANPLAVNVWESNPFQLNPAACLALSLPDRVSESAGVLPGALRVQLPRPTSTNLILQLTAASGRLSVPAELMIPAGQSEATADLIIANDSALTGPVKVSVTVTAPGFGPVNEIVILEDDETTTLQLEVPEQVTEGTTVEATLILGRVADADLFIPLSSSNPQRLNASLGFYVPAGSDRGGAVLSAVENTLLNDSVSVTVSASFADWLTASETVKVADNETNTIDLVVNFNEPAVEGQTVDLAITLGGGSTTNLPMRISVSNPARVITPDYPEFPAVGTGINVALTIVDDVLITGREEIQVEVSLPGYVTGRRSFVILDNDPGRLALTQPLGPHYINGNVVASVQAQTLEGDPLPQVDLSTAVVSLVGEGPLSFDATSPFASEGWHIVSAVPKTATPAARLRVEALGLRAESLPFSIWPVLTVIAPKWANCDAARDRLIIIPETGGMFAVATTTGTRSEFTTPITDADFAVVSDDGQTVHVVRSDRRRVARLNLASLAVEDDWELGTDPAGSPLRVDHLASIPGQPQAVVVCRIHSLPASPPEADRLHDLVVYDGPTIRPGRILLEDRNSLGSTVVVPAKGTDVFLVERGRIFSYNLSSSGLAESPASGGDWVGHDTGPTSGTAVEVQGTILTTRAQWLDPRLPGELGFSSLSFDENIFGFDPVRSVVAGIKAGDRPVLRLLSPHNLQELATLPLAEQLNAPVVRLEAAGPDRWLLVHNRQVRLIPTPPFLPLSPVDLGVTATVTDRDEHLATARVVFRVTNHSSQLAAEVGLSLGLPYTAFAAGRPPFWMAEGATIPIMANALGGQIFGLGNLEPGASEELPLVFPTIELGKINVSAVVGSAAPDPDSSNNRTEIRITDLIAPPPVLWLLPPDLADPNSLHFKFTTGYDYRYRLERAPAIDGPWENIFDQDLYGRGIPARFDTGKSESEDMFWRVRRVWPE